MAVVYATNHNFNEDCQSLSFICWKDQKRSYQINRFSYQLKISDSSGEDSNQKLYKPPDAGIVSGVGNSEDKGILLSDLSQNLVYQYDSLFNFKSRVSIPDLFISPQTQKHLIYYSYKFGLLVYLADTGRLLILREKNHKMQLIQTLAIASQGTFLEVKNDKLRLFADQKCVSQAVLSQNVFSITITNCSEI